MCGADCPGKRVKFCDPCRNHSREIPPEAVGGGIFDGCFRDNFRPEVASDVISGANVEQFSCEVRAKLCESMSNRSRDI